MLTNNTDHAGIRGLRAVVARKQTHCTLIGYRPAIHARIGVVNRYGQVRHIPQRTEG
jgi:hypothetical protein